jgi:hypothetical protein
MSRSLRVSDDLFMQASQAGDAFTRSAAQQVEHWARLGQKLEGSGLSVAELAALLEGRIEVADADEMMRDKRARQAEDVARGAKAKARSRESASTHVFGGGIGRRARTDGPY